LYQGFEILNFLMQLLDRNMLWVRFQLTLLLFLQHVDDDADHHIQKREGS
jgi:hypothetical protein